MNRPKTTILFIAVFLFLLLLPSLHAINVFAQIAPTATPVMRPRAVDASQKIYLPMICKNCVPPPRATTSRYVVTRDWNTLWNQGCNQARSGESGIVVLDFGDPDYNTDTRRYGTKLLGWSRPFVSVDEIWSLTAQFLQGYANASCNPTGKHIYLAVGTNNNGTKVTREHGIAWAQLVENVHQTITYPPSLADKVTAAGAIDAEIGWNSATITRAWVDGYKSITSRRYYNFGDCAGCNYPTGVPSNGWTWNDVWYISYGALPAYPLPLIYAKSGIHAHQWYTIALYTYNTYGYTMRFVGAFTQWQACQGNSAGAIKCRNDRLDNTPAEGWSQLYYKLGSDARTTQSPNDMLFSTDVTWAP